MSNGAPAIGTQITVSTPSWSAVGEVLAVAPFSVLIAYVEGDSGKRREDWFRVLNSKRHGDPKEDCTRYDVTLVC
jgi:hypothetical protein